MKKNFVIIGSGISSLTLALLLLKEGHKVTVLEQHYLAGGYLHCFRRFSFKYETGGHYLGALDPGLPFHKILDYLGVYHPEDYVRLDETQVDSYQFSDFTFNYASGYEENIRRLSSMFPTEKEKIQKYFDLVKESAHSFPTYYFKSEYDQTLMMKFLDLTLVKALNDFGISGKLRQILEAPCVLHGVSPEDVSFGVHSILIDSIMVSTHGFSSGGEKLANRFASKIKELGGEVLLSHKVKEIKLKDNLVSEVICENEKSFVADEYIAGIHPRELFNFIGLEHLKPAFRNRLSNISESVPFVGAYLVLKNSLGINPKSNYYFMPKSTQGAFHVKEASLDNQFGFFATPLRTYSGEGKFPLSVHASCPQEFFQEWQNSGKKITDPAYEAAKQKVFEKLFTTLDGRFEGFSQSITDICYSSSLTNSRFNPSPNGSAYGFYHDLTITGARALGPRTHFPNLYLTGQNSLFPGLLGATISGLRTSGFFTGLKDILRSLEQ